MRAGSPVRAARAQAEPERSLGGAQSELRSELPGTMLAPEAERVLQYLVEVEELAEAVLADKRQVGGVSVEPQPGFSGRGLLMGPVGERAGPGIWFQHPLAVG